MIKRIRFHLNGEKKEIEADVSLSLLDVLRDVLGMTGTKHGCGKGECGACTVIVNGKAVNSCLFPIMKAEGAEVLTVEGLQKGGELHPIQQAFIDKGAVQCGYCTPGMLLSAKALLDENPSPTRLEVKAAIGGNICRCTGYVKIEEAILSAAELIKEGR
ncbi:MAG: (2Fe-2S)-binding protein [Clostridiales bacterium]|nr:(2Fe-2S)-binding protein [Clostridiales bacterium]